MGRDGWRIGWFLVVLALGQTGILWGCDPEPGLFHYEYRVFKKENGLPCERIRSIWMAEDRVFVGTDGGGLMVFQNETWKSFTPQTEPPFPAATVNALCAGEDDQTVLAATNIGLVKIRFEDDRYSFKVVPRREGYSTNFLSLYKKGDGWLAGTDREAGLLLREDFLPFNNPPDLDETGFNAEFEQERKFFIGSSKGLFSVPEGSNLLQKVTPGEFGWVNALHGGPEYLLVGTSNGFFRIRKGKTETLLPEVWVTSMAGQPAVLDPTFKPPRNERHEFFVGTDKTGLLLYHSQGRTYHFTMDNSRLPSNSISALYAPPTATGQVWIGTPDAGLVQRRHVLPYAAEVSPEPANAVAFHDWLYVGTEKQGLQIYDAVSRERTGQVDPDAVTGFHQRVSAVHQDKFGRLWVAGDAGVWMRDRDGWHRFGEEEGLPAQEITLLQVREEQVYAATLPTATPSLFLSAFNGFNFTPITPESLAMVWAKGKEEIRQEKSDRGISGDLPHGLEIPLATDALAILKRTFPRLRPTALWDSPEFLVIGDENGAVFSFDGMRFSEWSLPAMGGKIVGIGRLGDGRFVIASEKKVVMGTPAGFKTLPTVYPEGNPTFTCLRVDDFKTSIFWVGVTIASESGAACFYNGEWTSDPFDLVPRDICAAQPYLFVATEKGTVRVLKTTKPGYFRERDALKLVPPTPPPGAEDPND